MNQFLFSVRVLGTFFLIFIITFIHGQDAHFSQFYASPQTLNPALTGSYNGTFRISTIYRDQWRSAIETPLKTFAASGDAKFNLGFGNKSFPDQVGVGITFLADRVNAFDFNTNQILLSVAYHKALDKKTKQVLSIGLQGGILQRTINYEDISFGDQFNSIDGYTLGTGELLPPNNRAYADYNLGIFYSISPTKTTDFHIGLGYYHFNKPNISFFNTPDIINPEVLKVDTLSSKFSIHTGLSLKVNDRLWIQPRVNALLQSPFTEINVGSTFRYKVSKTEGQYLLFGPYIRGVNSYDGFGIESLIGMVGYERNNFIIGLSYDQALGSFIKDRKSLSSFELSIIYIGEHHNEDNFCPQW